MTREECYDATKVAPPCEREKKCYEYCYYYNECWPEEQDDDDPF